MSNIDFFVDIPEGRNPRILMFSDIQVIQSDQQRSPDRLVKKEYDQWRASTVESNYKFCVRETIKKYNPDFIFTTGDNVYGEFDDSGDAHLDFVSFMDSFGIPWAPIFGNHDNESAMGADWQCEQFVKAKNCLFKQGHISGNCNYTVGIRQGGKLLRVFFMTDTNACAMSEKTASNGHSPRIIGLAEDQKEWVKDTSKAIKKEFCDVKLSIVFHIQIGAFANAINELGLGDKRGFNFDTDQDNRENFGYLAYNCGAWDGDESFFNIIREIGFDSVFVGHEHENSESIVYKGVRLTFGQKSSTYDKINYIVDDENHYKANSSRIGRPVWGGTGMELLESGDFVNMGIILAPEDK